MPPVSLIIAGGGGRGTTYASYASTYPDQANVIGVAEPREFYRQRLVREHAIPPDNVFTDWKDLAARPKFADAVVIATQDAMHVAPAIAFAAKGYNILLEKPMAPNLEGCQAIFEAVRDRPIIFAVCHVMRYTAYTKALKKLLDDGAIGEIVSLQHLEPVGYWHQAHSFVRGNWRNEAESSFMLLTKSCHDMDWIRYIIGSPCKSVSSFGNLKHFRKDQKPAEAGEAKRCLDCAYEPKCAYSARKIYIGRLQRGDAGWPVDVVSYDTSLEALTQALRAGPYGRCVYECDNDVVDHQVVSMEFEGGQTAVFTMTAFNQAAHRKTRIFGTRGEIEGDGEIIKLFDFLTDKTRVIDTRQEAAALSGHGGGDEGLMAAFVQSVASHDQRFVLSGPEVSFESHKIDFLAEQARCEHKVIDL